MPFDLRDLPRTLESDALATSRSLSATAKAKVLTVVLGTVSTGAGTYHINLPVPFAGTIVAAKFVTTDALAAHGSNYVTFAIVNKATGAGTTAVLAATDANTSKTTTGTAITAYAVRSLSLHGTAGNLAVAANDNLNCQVVATGTLANTLTGSVFQVVVEPTG